MRLLDFLLRLQKLHATQDFRLCGMFTALTPTLFKDQLWVEKQFKNVILH